MADLLKRDEAAYVLLGDEAAVDTRCYIGEADISLRTASAAAASTGTKMISAIRLAPCLTMLSTGPFVP